MRCLAILAVSLLIVFLAGCKHPSDDAVNVPGTNSSEVVPAGPGDAIPTSGTDNVAPAPAPSNAITTDEDANYFYDDLTPYGQWIEVPDYGPCWQPNNVAPGWMPYTDGYWIYTTDYGWYWQSNEPFGWCCDHYGRWTLLVGDGWCWVPGRVWGPSWVVWRQGNGEVGWAPLPPAAQGVSIDAEISALHPWAFRFVSEKYLTDQHVSDHFEPITRNVTLVGMTQNSVRFEKASGQFANRGIDVDQIERSAGTSIPRYTLSDASNIQGAQIRGNEVAAYRPQLPPRQSAPAATPLFDKGPPRTSTPAESDAQRSQNDAYYQNLQKEMAQRQQQESAQPPPAGRGPQEIQTQQQRERDTLDEQRRSSTPPANHQPPPTAQRHK